MTNLFTYDRKDTKAKADRNGYQISGNNDNLAKTVGQIDLAEITISTGNEVDLLRTIGNNQNAYEIKSGETFSPGYFKGVSYWSKLSGATPESCFAIYTGNKSIKSSFGEVISWFDF